MTRGADDLPPLDATQALPEAVTVITAKGRVRMTHLHPCDIDRTGRCNDAPLRIAWLYDCTRCGRKACRECFDAVSALCTDCGGVASRGIH